MENGFMGLDNQTMPNLTDTFVQTVSQRYIALYEKVTGMVFEGDTSDDPVADVNRAVKLWISNNS